MAFVVEDGTAKADANAGASVAEYDAYYEFHRYAPSITTDADKQKVIVMATRSIDASFTWKGSKVKYDQGIQFPRIGVVLPGQYDGIQVYKIDSENLTTEPYLEIPSNVVPKAYKDAILEMCRFIVLKDRDTSNDTAQIKRQRVDVIEREYFETGKPDIIPEIVQRILSELTLSEPHEGMGSATYVSSSRA